MLLGVFQEFHKPEVLERIKEKGICEIDIASKPCEAATTEEEKKVVRTNAKLIKLPHPFCAITSPCDTFSEEDWKELEKKTDLVLSQLTELGFEVVHRHPVTSTGCSMRDRVILSFPE